MGIVQRPNVSLSKLLGDVRPESVDLREYPMSAQPMYEKGKWRIINLNTNAIIVEDLGGDDAFETAHLLNRIYWFRFGIRW